MGNFGGNPLDFSEIFLLFVKFSFLFMNMQNSDLGNNTVCKHHFYIMLL